MRGSRQLAGRSQCHVRSFIGKGGVKYLSRFDIEAWEVERRETFFISKTCLKYIAYRLLETSAHTNSVDDWPS